MLSEVAAEFIGDPSHERDLVAEALCCCHDLPPLLRVSARVTLPETSDIPSRKSYLTTVATYRVPFQVNLPIGV